MRSETHLYARNAIGLRVTGSLICKESVFVATAVRRRYNARRRQKFSKAPSRARYTINVADWRVLCDCLPAVCVCMWADYNNVDDGRRREGERPGGGGLLSD